MQNYCSISSVTEKIIDEVVMADVVFTIMKLDDGKGKEWYELDISIRSVGASHFNVRVRDINLDEWLDAAMIFSKMHMRMNGSL